MKQKLMSIIGVGLMVAGLIFAIGEHFDVEAQHQPPPPTPKGQLGGAPRLTPLIGGEETVTPVPVIATPSPGATGEGAASSAVCAIAPRALDEVVARVGATPVAGGLETTQGVPADAATVDAVTGVLGGFVACLNQGDQLRALAYMTDNAVSQALGKTGWDVIAASTRLALLQPRAESDRMTIRAVSNVIMLPDGHVLAHVELVDPARFPIGVATTWQVQFATVDGEWRIDAVVEAAP